jgi:hypothetical protein
MSLKILLDPASILSSLEDGDDDSCSFTVFFDEQDVITMVKKINKNLVFIFF